MRAARKNHRPDKLDHRYVVNEQAESFMGVTVHFVTSDGSIEKHGAMLDLAIASERSTSDALWRQLDAILHKFGIQENIGTIKSDNGRNMVHAMEDLAFPTAATRLHRSTATHDTFGILYIYFLINY